MSIGENIHRKRKEADMTLEEVAARVGISRQTMSRYETGVIGNIPSDKIELIAKAVGTTPAYLMGWEDGLPPGARPMPTTVKKPRLGTIACGTPILAEENIEDYDEVPDWVKCDFTLLCKGDSMINARIYDGDIVCIKRQEIVENGQIAAVLIDGDFDCEATLKRFYFSGGTVTLMAENPTFPPLVFTGEEVNRVHVIGLATHFICLAK